MALEVHTKKAESTGHAQIFLLHFIITLLLMALFLAVILLIGSNLNWESYSKYYVILIPLTIILPLIIGITTALSYKRVEITISPASLVDTDKLKDFFYREAYVAIDQEENNTVFERARFLPRFLTLGYDKPYIIIENDQVRLNMLKRLSLVLKPQLEYGTRFELKNNDKDK